MKAEYCVEPTVEVYIDPACEIPDKMRIDDADVYFEISDDKLLKKVTVAYTELQIKIGHGGGPDGKGMRINPSYPEVNNKAFKLMSGLLNYIQLKTGRPAFDINRLNNIFPTISPETPEEEEKWKNIPKTILKEFRTVIECVREVNFDDFKIEHAKAYENFADAKNAQNPISKYESFYKVVESFFNCRGKDIDQGVSVFMGKYNCIVTPANFKELRDFRNRCMHPHHDDGHIASNDIELTEELVAKAGRLERIAELLFKHK